MNHLIPTVTLIDGQPRVSSLDIAEKFGKTHKDVLRSIQNLIADLSQDFRERNFALTSRNVPGPNNSQRQEPFFQLTRDGFSLLAMGFTGKAALEWKVRYIEAFNAMEEELLKKLESKRPRRKKAIEAPIDPYQAYLDEVENVRAKTIIELKRLLGKGLDLIDVYKFRTRTHDHFTAILIDWLERAVVSPTELKRQAFTDKSPVMLIKELSEMLPDIRN